jgi:cell division septation protein DedD
VGIDASDPGARESAAAISAAAERAHASARRDLWTPVIPSDPEHPAGESGSSGAGALPFPAAATSGSPPTGAGPRLSVHRMEWDGVERRGRSDSEVEGALASTLEEEVRTGRARVRPIRRSRAGLIGGVAAGLAVAASVVAIVMRSPSLPPGDEVMPSGNERVLSLPDRPIEAALGGGPSALPAGGALTPVRPDSSAATAGTPAAEATPPAGLRAAAPTPRKPFRVHVASFRSIEKVEQIAASLRGHGAEAWIERAEDVPGYYRVFVGRFATEAEARAHAQWLLQNGWVDRAQAYPLTER